MHDTMDGDVRYESKTRSLSANWPFFLSAAHCHKPSFVSQVCSRVLPVGFRRRVRNDQGVHRRVQLPSDIFLSEDVCKLSRLTFLGYQPVCNHGVPLGKTTRRSSGVSCCNCHARSASRDAVSPRSRPTAFAA